MAAVKKRHFVGQLEFKTAALANMYRLLQERLEQKDIQSFDIPSMDETVAANKFGATKCKINGLTLDSLMEARYFLYLIDEKKAGRVTFFQHHPQAFVLQPSFFYEGKTVRAITYTADFEVRYSTGSIAFIDTKGTETDAFKLKWKMLLHKHPDIHFACVQYKAKEKLWIDLHDKSATTAKRKKKAEKNIRCQTPKNPRSASRSRLPATSRKSGKKSKAS